LVVAIMAGAAALVGCAPGSKAAGDASLQVDLRRFVIEPAVLEAPAGDLQLRVTNVDPEFAHDLVVLGKGTRPLAPGQTQVLQIPDAAAGEYRMWCDVPGHASAGQVGTLVLKAAT
jgi:plastocyanin